MIYHFLRGNTFHLSPAVIESILNHADHTSAHGVEDHFFCIMNFSTKYQYTEESDIYLKIFNKYETSNYKFIDTRIDFIRYIKTLRISSDKYIFHGTIQPYKFQIFIYILLFIFRRKMLAACSLICWGEGDFNLKAANRLVNYLLAMFHGGVFRRMLCLYALSSEDLKLLRMVYPKANSKSINYFHSLNMSRKTIRESRLNIMVSHSGWPANMHVEVFELLAKFKNENIRIVCPLCYGDPQYIERIIEVGQREFGDKFSYFTNIKPIEKYEELIKSMDVYISAAKIQTGLFALMTSIAAGARVILRGNLLLSMRQYGFTVNELESIAGMEFEEISKKLSDIEYINNINTLRNKYVNTSELEDKWRQVYGQE